MSSPSTSIVRGSRRRAAAPSAARSGTGTTRRRAPAPRSPTRDSPGWMRERRIAVARRRSRSARRRRAARRPGRRSAARACAARRAAGTRRRRTRAPRSADGTRCRRCRGTDRPSSSGNAPPAPRTTRGVAFADHRTPRRASASRITRVSSASSRPRISVSPSRERGEQQDAVGDALRAGQPHRARARGGPARGRRSRSSRVLGSRLRVHRVARLARLRANSFSSAAAVAALRAAARTCASFAPIARPARASSASRLARQMSRHISGWLDGDAGEIAEAAGGVGEQLRRRSRRVGDVVRPARTRARAADGSPPRAPRRARSGVESRDAARRSCARRRARARRRSRVLGERRQHHAPAAEQLGARRGGAALLGAGDRMAGHESAPMRRAERRARRGDDVALGAAGVGDEVPGSEVRRERARTPRICATGAATSTRSASAQRSRHPWRRPHR